MAPSHMPGKGLEAGKKAGARVRLLVVRALPSGPPARPSHAFAVVAVAVTAAERAGPGGAGRHGLVPARAQGWTYRQLARLLVLALRLPDAHVRHGEDRVGRDRDAYLVQDRRFLGPRGRHVSCACDGRVVRSLRGRVLFRLGSPFGLARRARPPAGLTGSLAGACLRERACL